MLPEFIEGNEKLDKILAGMEPQDWDTPCYHAMGPEPVRVLMDMRITETVMQGWDIRSVFDPQASLHPDTLTALTNTISRAVRRAFRPDPGRTRSVRYRFEVAGPVITTSDVVLNEQRARFETSAEGQADVVFRCDTVGYVMVMFGRVKLDVAIGQRSISAQGGQELVSEFVQAFVGG